MFKKQFFIIILATIALFAGAQEVFALYYYGGSGDGFAVGDGTNGITLTWDGSSSTDWDTADNWDLGLVPQANDTAVIANVANQPTLGSNTEVTNLTINTGATLSLDGNNLTVSGTYSNSGTLQLNGDETTVSLTNDSDSGLTKFVKSTGTITIKNLSPYYDLEFDSNSSGDGDAVFTLPAAIDVNNNLTITDGTLDVAASNYGITVGGNWTNASNEDTTFNARSGTVTFDTTATATILGATTFYNFSCVTGSKPLTFTKNTTYTINNALTLNGQQKGAEIVLRSSEDGSSYTLDFPNGVQTIYHVDLRDCTAGTNASAARNSINTANNTGWTFTMVDPYGIVFDSVSNNPVKSASVTLYYDNDSGQGRSWITAVAGTHIAAGDTNPQTTGTYGTYAYNCINGDYYIAISATGYDYPSIVTSFPSGRTVTTGSKGEVFTINGGALEMDQPMDSNNLLLKINKDANKKEVVVGDVVTYSVTIENETGSDVTNVYLEDKIPAGFKYISGKAILDNAAISDPAGNRPLTFNIGTVTAGQTRTLKYQLVVGSGVTFGNYENSCHAKYSDGTVISNKATETVKVVPDPLFDLGTIIGKVFWDRNENGIQDKGEEPIPNAQIATEEGTLITTDKDGKYHLAAIIPGRHLLRVDERTLPQGAYLTTDKAVIVDITPGILAKVNFGANSKDRKQTTEQQKLPVNIIQERIKPIPRLNAAYYPQDSRYEFRIFTNYSLFIDKWKLEILDKDTKSMVEKFEGSRLTLNEPIVWGGKDKQGKLLNAERNYVYVLTVIGKDGKKDVTKEREFKVTKSLPRQGSGLPTVASHPFDFAQGKQATSEKTEKEIEQERQGWLEQESKINNLEKQNIRIDGEMVKVSGLSGHQVIRVKKGEKIEGEIPVVQSQGITASEVLESPQKLESQAQATTAEIILPKGEYDIEGEHIKVGEDYLFFVGMGDAKMGYTFNRGDIEPVQHDDKFKEGFWSEGKAAYYLKGKIKGKYLITSSLDTERDKKELFKNLDPDKYYPVYGDAASINYDAANTQGPLYLLIEWDKSSAIWGNYNTALTDTEFAAFNRTLYGGKINYESVSVTQWAEPKTKLIVFKARAQQKAAHNEFVGTGGSLFYLKNKDVIEGSDKVKIEVRDKITGLVLASKEMEEGVDYEIDYSNGRLTFWQPISHIAESDSIISSSLLDGNSVYVAVDYEYEAKDKYDEGIIGARAQQSLADYLRVGATYVKEEQLDKNYELRGTDTTLHLGKDIKITGEYAESESEGAGSFISTDGGLSFTTLATGDLDKGKAYGLKAEALAFGRLGLTAYYKQIEKGFSSASTISQQGKELMGAAATLDITPKTRLKVSHDIQKLINEGNLQTQLQVGAQKTETSTAQIVHQTEKLRLTGEYRHQKVTGRLEQFESETNKQEDTAAVKADYKLTEKIDVSVEQQVTLKGVPDHQTSAGVNAAVNKHLTLRAKETIGTQGAATGVGVSANIKDRFEVSSDYTRANYKTGEIGDTASLSGKAKINEKTQVYTTAAVTDSSQSGQTQSLVFGSERKVNEELTLASSKTYAKNRDNLIQGNSYGLTREKEGKRLEGTFTEQESQSDTEVSNTNIFGLSGDINDSWAAQGSFERGLVQNHDGTQATRNAGSVGIGFVDKDPKTGEVKLKASSKLEVRLDNGQEDKRQYLAYNAVEGKVNPNTALFAKVNLSQTKNTTTKSAEAEYKELSTGLAYRPINFDRLNLLGRYTYLEDNSPSGQTDISDIEKEKSHTLAGEAVYDLTDKWQLVEKLAYKIGEEKVTGFEFTKTQTWLAIQRVNYNINKDWQLGAEYRRLTQKQAKDYKQGALVEVARKVGDFIQAGLGYNFTDFNDDLTHLDYTAQGPFVRLTGKFYDRTPEEIERARLKWLEQMVKIWAWELVNEELAKPDSTIMQELYKYFYLAENLRAEGRLKESKEFSEKILQIGNIMYQEAEVYVRNRIELEKSIKENNRLAYVYYKEGKLQEAKALWQKLIKEAEPVPIDLKF